MKLRAAAAVAVLLGSPALTAQQPAEPDVWSRLKYFVGSWEGTGSGPGGGARAVRSYEFVLGDNYLLVKNRSTYEPQQKNPRGEVQEDWGFVSYDRGRSRFAMRRFHTQGFVEDYVLESALSGKSTLVFKTERIENIPEGWRARTVIRILGPDEFVETLEMAGPGQEFETRSETQLRRKK